MVICFNGKIWKQELRDKTWGTRNNGISAVVNKRFVDKIGEKLQHVDKDCFVDIMYYYEKERNH